MTQPSSESQIQQVIYFNDSESNFYRVEVISGNIFSEQSVLKVFRRYNDSWVYLGERKANNPIKIGKPLWGTLLVQKYFVEVF